MNKHKVLGYVEVIGSTMLLILAIGFRFVAVPKLTGMYSDLGVGLPSTTYSLIKSINIITISIALYSAITFYVGLKLVKSDTLQSNKFWKIGLILLPIIVLVYMSIPFIFLQTVIFPIYKLTSEF